MNKKYKYHFLDPSGFSVFLYGEINDKALDLDANMRTVCLINTKKDLVTCGQCGVVPLNSDELQALVDYLLNNNFCLKEITYPSFSARDEWIRRSPINTLLRSK